MKMYLSAYRLGRRASILGSDGGRAAIVMNALDAFPNRRLSWGRETHDLERLGYSSTELDLRTFWDEPGALAQHLNDVDLLWVVGGNAFVLARAATAAGLAHALRQTPHITYAGYSAGACLTSLDLTGIELMDPPDQLPSGYRAGMPEETLTLMDTRIVPHAGTPYADAVEQRLRAAGLTYTTLADGEDLLLGF